MYHSVIVIDDSVLERFLAEKLMQNCRFAEQVTSFNSPIDALQYLTSLKNSQDKFPEVIFVDIQMPLMNGFEFLDKFMEFPEDARQHSKIVMFSSSQAPEDYSRMKQHPVIARFLSKPLSEESFRSLVL